MGRRSNPNFQPLGLPLWSAPLPEEPAHGLFMRLVEINGYVSLSEVETETALSMVALHRCKDHDKLASLVRQDISVFCRDSFTRIEGSRIVIRGEIIYLKNDLDLERRRVCPACLRESNHHRFFWDLGFVSTCPRHGINLVSSCNCVAGRKLSWKDARVHRGRCCREGDLRREPGTPASPETLAMDGYFAGRLDLGPKVALPALDELSLGDCVDLLNRVGSLEAVGLSKCWMTAQKLGLDPITIRARAFAIISQNRMHDVLDKVYAGFEASGSELQPSLTTAYGWFYHWFNLKGNQSFSLWLTEQLYSHAATRFRIDRRAMRNKSVVVSEQTLTLMAEYDQGMVTLSAAAKMAGVHLMRIRRIAVPYGLMRQAKKSGAHVLLKRDDAKILAFLAKHTISMKAVAAMLGTHDNVVQDLTRLGHLTPVLLAGRDPTRTTTYLRGDVEVFVNRLTANVSSPCPTQDRARTLLQCRRQVRADVLCAAIFSGAITPAWIDPGKTGFQAIMVDDHDVEKLKTQDAKALPLARTLPAPARPTFEYWRTRAIALASSAHHSPRTP